MGSRHTNKRNAAEFNYLVPLGKGTLPIYVFICNVFYPALLPKGTQLWQFGENKESGIFVQNIFSLISTTGYSLIPQHIFRSSVSETLGTSC